MNPRLWLRFLWDVHVPAGLPTRRLEQVVNPTPQLKLQTDDQGVIKDGNPFCLFWDEDGAVQHRVLTPDDTSITVCGRALELVWRVLPGNAGVLLLVYGLLNVPDLRDGADERCLTQSEGTFPALPAAHSFCFAWNNAGTATGGTIARHVGLAFGLPESMLAPPSPPKQKTEDATA